MKLFWVTQIALLFCLTSCDRRIIDEKGIIHVENDDPEMNAAKQEARKTINRFLDAQKAAGDDFSGMLKVYFSDPAAPDDGEHMWVTLTKYIDDRFEGILLSTPGKLTSVQSNDDVKFSKADISDWLYVENGKAKGAYTVKLLRDRMSEAERIDHDSHYPFSFD